MGYGGSRRDAARAVGGSGDEGIDGIIDEDRLGLDTIYIQAKKWKEDSAVGDRRFRNLWEPYKVKGQKKEYLLQPQDLQKMRRITRQISIPKLY